MKRNSGNALWLILIAIFLLGGLTVLVTRTGSQTEDTGVTEKSRIEASQLISRSINIKNAVDSLFSRGCSENEISFNYTFNTDGTENTSSGWYNSNSPADFSCHVFHVKGAGISGQKGSENFGFYDRIVTGVGTNKTDAIFYIRTLLGKADKIDTQVCNSINKLLANNFSITSLPQSNLSSDSSRGTYAGPTVGNTSNDSAMAGVKSGCVIDTGCGGGTCNVFYLVVVTR